MKFIGALLLLTGCFSLVFNEFTTRLRRAWPWRRDDLDPARDRWLNELYRCGVFGGSILSIELGHALAEVTTVPWPARVLIYAIFGVLLFWLPPATRTRAFWERALHHGRKPPRNDDSTTGGN